MRIQTQQKADKNKLYAFHAPEVECISKGKAKQQYEFGVKVSIAVTHKEGLIVGARSFSGSPYDGHTLAEQLEQTTILLQNMQKADQSAIKPTTAVGDLGYRGVLGVAIALDQKQQRFTLRYQKRVAKAPFCSRKSFYRRR